MSSAVVRAKAGALLDYSRKRRYADGGRNENDLRDQRARNSASREPNDSAPKAGLTRSSVHDIVGHPRRTIDAGVRSAPLVGCLHREPARPGGWR